MFVSQRPGKGGGFSQHFCQSMFAKVDNLSEGSGPKTNFVCIKPHVKVFQVTFDLFVHLFNDMIKIRSASYA